MGFWIWILACGFVKSPAMLQRRSTLSYVQNIHFEGSGEFVENSEEHGLDGIAWPGARASQFIKVTTSQGMHGETNLFSIC